MCPPVVAALMVVTAVVGAAGQVQAGKAQKAMADFNARSQEEASKYNADRQQDRSTRLLGTARVNINKSGLQMSGSPLDVLADSATEAELDRQAILRMGNNQAELSRMQGRQAQRAGYFGAATTLLSGAAKAGGAFGGVPGG